MTTLSKRTKLVAFGLVGCTLFGVTLVLADTKPNTVAPNQADFAQPYHLHDHEHGSQTVLTFQRGDREMATHGLPTHIT